MAGAQEVAAFYQTDTNTVRTGLLLTMACAALWIPWSTVIAMQTALHSVAVKILGKVQIACAAAVPPYVILPAMIWTAIAFRPDRDPEIMLMMHDLGWLIFVMVFSPALVQTLAIGLAILADRSPSPKFPRWSGFFNLWVALVYVAGGLATYFKTGPFAWNGILAFWVPLAIIGVWMLTMCILTRKSILNEANHAPG